MVKRTPKKYTRGQTWGALRKAWGGYRAALAEGDKQRLQLQKQHVHDLQKQLGLRQTQFRDSLKVTYLTKRRAAKRRTSPRAGRRTSPRAARRRSPGRRVFRRAGRRSPSPKLRR